MKRRILVVSGVLLGLSACAAIGLAVLDKPRTLMGRQPDGSFIVATEQRIEPGAIAFDGRPIDLALHPSGAFVAVLGQENYDPDPAKHYQSPTEDHAIVFLVTKGGIIAGSSVKLGDGTAYRGAAWSPDGTRLFVSTAAGYIQEILLSENKKLSLGHRIVITPDNDAVNPRPGGLCITRDGTRLFAAAADRNAVSEVDLTTDTWVREYRVQTMPFEVRLSTDEKTLIASDWGGRLPKDEDEVSPSGSAMIVVDPRGVGSSGTVSLIERATGKIHSVPVGLHPTAIAVSGESAYVANAAGDTISEIDVPQGRVKRTIPIKWGGSHLFGAMPDALAIVGNTLYACDGGDNAVCEISLPTGLVRGFRPAGFFPTGIQLTSRWPDCLCRQHERQRLSPAHRGGACRAMSMISRGRCRC